MRVIATPQCAIAQDGSVFATIENARPPTS
jgi:hypothetical protein